MSIAVVTDSTSDLSPELASKHGITIVPLNVHIQDEEYLDGVTITADEMYRRLPDQKVIPTTSAPSVGSFVKTYEELAKTHDEIISIHLSSKLSLTYNAAMNAVSEMNSNETRIEVVDSLTASMALGWTAVQASEAAANGANLDEVVALAKSASSRGMFIGMVDSLEYLVRGGRIGKAQGFVGSLLRIRPILVIRDGEAHPLERARSRKKGIARLKGMIAEYAPLDNLTILYTTDKAEAQAIADEVSDYDPSGTVSIAQMGPVIGNYAGPGTMGLGLITAKTS